MEEDRYQQIADLREKVIDEVITNDEFNKLVSDEEYKEWSELTEKRFNDIIKDVYVSGFK